MKVPDGVAVVGRTEMDRLGTLLRPNTPQDTTYQISPRCWMRRWRPMSSISAALCRRFRPTRTMGSSALREHALAWAIRHLRGRVGEEFLALHGNGTDLRRR